MKTNLILLILSMLLAGGIPLCAQETQSANPTFPGGTGQITEIPLSNTIEGRLVTERTYQGARYTTTEHHYDGMGREVKTVAVGAAPTGGNIVTERVYDCMGHGDSIVWLPYVPDSVGLTLATARERVTRFYRQLLGDDPDAMFAATRTHHDNSPLGLTVAADEPGLYHSLASTKGHPIRFDCRLNYHNQIAVLPLQDAEPAQANIVLQPAKTDRVKAFRIVDDSLLVYTGYHPAGRLLVREKTSQSTDTLQITVLDYIDKDELLVAKEIRTNGRSEHFSYYVYDDYGKLRYEIPSIQDKLIATPGTRYAPTDLDKYCTYHGYDTRGNEILTIRPGRERIERICDDRGREVLTQDGNLREANRWLYVKYDDYDRVLETYMVTTTFAPDYLRFTLGDLSGAALHEAVEGFCSNRILLMQIHYDGYEDYDLVEESGNTRSKRYRPFVLPAELSFVSGSVVSRDDLYPNNTGLKTYEKIAVLPDVFTDTTAYIERAFYYDKDGLLLQTVVRNHLGGINRLSYKYDQGGNQIACDESRTTGPDKTPVVIRTRNQYDDYGRLLTERKQIPGVTTSTRYVYDELGRVATMIQGEGKITTTYKYDIAGRTIRQENALFRMNLATDKPTISAAEKSYSGQISQCSWAFTGDREVSSYLYYYTAMGQMKSAKRFQNNKALVATFTEDGLRYDDNDNILSLRRFGDGRAINSIQYQYDGNRLVSTTDRGVTTNYDYDQNGNVVSQNGNVCTYKYNYLNLVEEVRLNGSVAARYKYLADGTKLEVSDPLGGGYLYLGSLIYNKRGNIYEPESTGFAGGRVVFASSGSDVQYHVTDYLGSVRVVADRDGKLLEKIDYYPFGKRIETAQHQVTGNRYLFNGKEWQSTGRVNLLDYGARMYDPNLGRWFGQDPEYQSANPYAFCFNNPVRFIDPDGRRIRVWSSEKGKYYEWKQWMGTWGFYDNNNDLYDGKEEELQKIGQALMILVMGGGEGLRLVTALSENNFHRIYIKIGARETITTFVNDYNHQISWLATSNTFTPTTKSSHDVYIPFIALAHELIHVRNKMEGKFAQGNFYDGTSLDEIPTVHYENIIRQEHNLPLRTHYENKTISIKLLDSQNRSLYIDKEGNTNFKRIPNKFENNRFQYQSIL